VGSNPAGGMDICHLRVLWVVRERFLRGVDHSSRGVLPTVMRHCVRSRNFVNEEAMTHCGLVALKETKETDKTDTTNYCMKEKMAQTLNNQWASQ